MADAPVFRSPITACPEPRAGEGRLLLVDESHLAKLVVKATEPAVAESMVAGLGHSVVTECLVCCVRPGEWLLVGAAHSVEAASAEARAAGQATMIDHTHALGMLRLVGDDSVGVLAKLCSIDLTDLVTPDGAAVSAPVARVNCDIVRNDVAGRRSYVLAFDRSYGQYLFDTLLDAGAEHDLAAAPTP